MVGWPTAVRRTVILVALASGLSAGRAAAQTDLDTASLADLMNVEVSTASRQAEAAASAPARMTVVTAAQIERRGYRSLTDVLKDLVDFKIDLGGDPDYPAEISVQGSRGTGRVALLLDGVPITWPTHDPAPILANYPVHEARQIEICYGPASAIYGADAFSAVINIITRHAGDRPSLDASASVGQFGLSNQTVFFGAPLGRRAAITIDAQVFRDRQPDMSRFYPALFGTMAAQRTGVFDTVFGPMSAAGASRDYQAPIAAHAFHVTLKAGGWEGFVFQNGAQVSSSEPYTAENAVYDATAFNRTSLFVAFAEYRQRLKGAVTRTSLTYSRGELDPQSGYWNVYTGMQRGYKYAFSSFVRALEQVEWNSGPVRLVSGLAFRSLFAIPVGADLNAPVRSRDQPGTILGTDIPDEFYNIRYTNTAAFTQAQFVVTDSVTVTAGARFDHNTRYGDTLTPRTGLVLHPRRTTTMKVMFGTAFLAPAPYEAYAHWGSFVTDDGGLTYHSDYWHRANPDLRPQREVTIEASLTHAIGSGLAISASAFRSRMTDTLVESDPDRTGPGVVYGWPVSNLAFAINEGREHLYGMTAGLEFVRAFAADRRIEAHAAVSLTDGHVLNDDSLNGRLSIGGMAPVQVRAGVDLDRGAWSAAPRLTVVGEQRLFATVVESDGTLARRTIPGYGTVDLNLRRRGLWKGIDAFLTIENVFDSRYRTINARGGINPEEMVGVPQNPRRVSIGVTVKMK